ncbi:hypothetical protein BDB00DRAFT_833698 [Zychaea mexicana]|uniref:uncharacterized protein n=1 Tax=Zychaea mexicana TaxID=64656 RepID=UPI0022FEFA20|nr:uncharacterized protein BDB00DRAFT_833698 [Zychaea mexicana]KAI9491261.1 hypothetical protein BDB00DRAFT_833698 [Zychaea mexicana]
MAACSDDFICYCVLYKTLLCDTSGGGSFYCAEQRKTQHQAQRLFKEQKAEESEKVVIQMLKASTIKGSFRKINKYVYRTLRENVEAVGISLF